MSEEKVAQTSIFMHIFFAQQSCALLFKCIRNVVKILLFAKDGKYDSEDDVYAGLQILKRAALLGMALMTNRNFPHFSL